MAVMPAAAAVAVPLSEVNSGEHGAAMASALERAYGSEGLGILLVRDVPDLAAKRQGLLPLARAFANLKEEVKAKYEDGESHFSFGWSHGKEKLSNGAFDTFKGSFYNNPLENRPCDDAELMKQHPSYLRPNVWPTDDLPALEPAFMDLGTCIVNVGRELLRHCDAYVRARRKGGDVASIERTVADSRCHKARLLYYFPMSADDAAGKEQDAWCGWHTDHGSLTGLVSARFTNADGAEVANPVPDAGLYIRNRAGEVVRVVIPPDCIAFQIGESAQVASGGLLRATPHCVSPGTTPAIGVDRSTFAVFMQPSYDAIMDVPKGDEESVRADIGSRWTPGCSFGEFTTRTLEANYG